MLQVIYHGKTERSNKAKGSYNALASQAKISSRTGFQYVLLKLLLKKLKEICNVNDCRFSSQPKTKSFSAPSFL